MILQALKEYYDRKAADPKSGIETEGFKKQPIPFLIVIDRNGKFSNLEDTREQIGKRLVAKIFLVPRPIPRSGSLSYKTTFLLWDHIGYVLQYPDNKKAENQHSTWLKRLEEFSSDLKDDVGIVAIKKFYESGGVGAVKAHSAWNECIKIPSCNIAFKLADETLPIPCSSVVQGLVRKQTISTNTDHGNNDEGKVPGCCIVTGNCGEIVRVHSDTRISKDSKKLVGFQKNSGYDSYGKEQGYNAPVGKIAEFAYTTALNTLLRAKSRLLVGDAVTVFWSAKETDFENTAGLFFSEPPKDDPNRYTDAIKAVYESIWSGTWPVPDDDTRFYVLGLSPNSARIAVRFWHVGTVREIGTRLKQHINDLAIVHLPLIQSALPLWKLLRSIAMRGEDKNIPPNLSGETMRAILDGLPYPQTLLQAAIRRIRTEHEISYPRAALIKACINRSTRYKNPEIKEELKMSLDESNINIGYRLGRLFATLEKIQQEANSKINATIRDKFYASASSSPVTVFANLMRLKNHHLSKLENVGRRVNFERLIGEIISGDSKESGISEFPPHLTLGNQGRFAIGYYHQMQDFYTKKDKQGK